MNKICILIMSLFLISGCKEELSTHKIESCPAQVLGYPHRGIALDFSPLFERIAVALEKNNELTEKMIDKDIKIK